VPSSGSARPDWRSQARQSGRYLIFGGMLGLVGSTFVLSHLVANATVIGFALAFAGVPLLFVAHRTLPGMRK
jgi:hypothetical protein